MNADSDNLRSEFRSLCQQAEVAYSRRDSRGAPDLVPFGQQIIQLVHRHPEHRVAIEHEFRELWHSGIGPWELISYCMHTLRWPSIREFFEAVLQEAQSHDDWRAIPIAAHILSCFRDDWQDLDLFADSSVATP